ncbi:MAG: MFS transporter [Betaproteobacteria bacterium]|nr:MFS transporter [Betaproteobacteria bacterium]
MRETIFLLALASANSGISLRIIEPMLPRLAEDFGLSIPATASVITAYALAAALGTLAYGPLGDRYGKLRVATVSLFLAGLASLACVLAQGAVSLAALRFVTALFASSATALGMAYIGDRVVIAERQPVIARFIAGTLIGQAAGPVVGGLVTDLVSWRGALAVLGAVYCVVAAILYLRTRAQWANERPVATRANPFILYPKIFALSRVRYVLAAAIVDTSLFFGAYSFLGPFLNLKFGLSLSMIGTILAGFGIGGVLYTIFVRKLLRALGQRGLVGWGSALCCLCYVLATLLPFWQTALPATICMGFTYYMLHNTLQTKATEMAPEMRGTAVSIYTSTWTLGQAMGVAAMGVAVETIGYAPAIIGFALGFFAFGLWLRGNLQRL